MIRILFCTGRPPYPLIYGDNLIVYHVASQLSKENEVFLLSLSNGDQDKENARILERKRIFNDIMTINSPKLSVAGKWLDRVLSDPRKYISLRYPGFAERFVFAVRKLVKKNGIDIIHAHGLFISLLLTEYLTSPKVAVLVDSMGLHLQREVESATTSGRWVKKYLYHRTVKMEQYVLETYNSVVVVSPKDTMFLGNLNEKVSIEVIPNGVNTDYFCPVSDVSQYKERPVVLFFGNMAYEPNQDAAHYIAREIFPFIKTQLGSTMLYIVGAHPFATVKELGNDASVVVTGFVDDIREYISKADVVLAPMSKGSGIKNKILEAMSMGKAVVTNSIGAEGLNDEAKQCLLVVDDPRQMALKVVELLRNSGRRGELGKKARDIALSQYSWASCGHRYYQAYEKTISGSK